LPYRYFIHLSFKGTHYHGWQVQPGVATVQEVLEQKLSLLLQEKINTTGAGRTDAGVHASSFYAHFDTCHDNLHHPQKFIHQLNCILPWDIAVHDIIAVHPAAHARFDALSRTYFYRIAQVKDPFHLEFSTFFSKKVDIGKMNQAAVILKEYTDFTSFSKLHTDVKTNNCKIYHAEWIQQGTELHFTISADRFLRNMVRAIVGTLLIIGQGKMEVERIRDIIEGKNRSKAGNSVDSNGLHLIKIDYPESVLKKIDITGCLM
jgi:tRNA pseudouridine38-40 synthase